MGKFWWKHENYVQQLNVLMKPSKNIIENNVAKRKVILNNDFSYDKTLMSDVGYNE